MKLNTLTRALVSAQWSKHRLNRRNGETVVERAVLVAIAAQQVTKENPSGCNNQTLLPQIKPYVSYSYLSKLK